MLMLVSNVVSGNPSFYYKFAGETIKFKCNTSIEPTPTWKRNNVRIAAVGTELVLANITQRDAGIYQCYDRTATWRLNDDLSYLYVKNNRITTGETVRMECYTPHRDVMWVNNRATIYTNGVTSVAFRNRFYVEKQKFPDIADKNVSTLVIYNVSKSDSNTYQCVDRNGFGEILSVINLQVSDPPELPPTHQPTTGEYTAENFYVHVRETVYLSCFTNREITWYFRRSARFPYEIIFRNRQLYKPKLTFQRRQSDTWLTVANVTYVDTGNYRCADDLGKVWANVNLVVL